MVKTYYYYLMKQNNKYGYKKIRIVTHSKRRYDVTNY